VNHAAIRDVRLHDGADPEHRPANRERQHKTPASAEASQSMHHAPFRLGEMLFASSAGVSVPGRLTSNSGYGPSSYMTVSIRCEYRTGTEQHQNTPSSAN
jgi:hypothetical protein